jgi:hypothetical protein
MSAISSEHVYINTCDRCDVIDFEAYLAIDIPRRINYVDSIMEGGFPHGPIDQTLIGHRVLSVPSGDSLL